MDDVSDLPSWPKVIAWSAAFLTLWIGITNIIGRLITGEWGGSPEDPFWIGLVATGAGLAISVVLTILAVAVTDVVSGRLPDNSVPPDICAHPNAVPVESAVTGEILAALCPACDVQLSVVMEESWTT